MFNAFCALGLFSCDPNVSNEVHSAFLQHMAHYGLSYGTQDELQFRLELFAKQDAYIKEMNSQNLTFTLGHNKFSTWTEDEFKKILGTKPKEASLPTDYPPLPPSTSQFADWRTKNAVTSIKDQRDCSSGWAFSAVAAIESAHKIASYKLLALAEQQILDCFQPGDYGCSGGFYEKAFDYATTSPLMGDSGYPYRGYVNPECFFDESKAQVKVQSVIRVEPSNSEQLIAAVERSPVAVSLSGGEVLRNYKEGVISGEACGTDESHAVVIIGYNLIPAPDTPKYFIVKNSWGMTWGEMGYARVAIEDGDGVCGIQKNPMFPTTN